MSLKNFVGIQLDQQNPLITTIGSELLSEVQLNDKPTIEELTLLYNLQERIQRKKDCQNCKLCIFASCISCYIAFSIAFVIAGGAAAIILLT